MCLWIEKKNTKKTVWQTSVLYGWGQGQWLQRFYSQIEYKELLSAREANAITFFKLKPDINCTRLILVQTSKLLLISKLGTKHIYVVIVTGLVRFLQQRCLFTKYHMYNVFQANGLVAMRKMPVFSFCYIIEFASSKIEVCTTYFTFSSHLYCFNILATMWEFVYQTISQLVKHTAIMFNSMVEYSARCPIFKSALFNSQTLHRYFQI